MPPIAMTETSEPIPTPDCKVAIDATPAPDGLRHDWTRDVIAALFELPFNQPPFQAQVVRRRRFDPCKVQLSRLLSIKTGGRS
jgi:biotin synthase